MMMASTLCICFFPVFTSHSKVYCLLCRCIFVFFLNNESVSLTVLYCVMARACFVFVCSFFIKPSQLVIQYLLLCDSKHMCGILCVFGHGVGTPESVNQQPCLLPSVLRGAKRLRHRGPDASGVHISPNAILAHERLAIIDPSGKPQPLTNAHGNVWLAVNGEIFNYKELRNELKHPDKFMTNSDCECLLHLYEEHKDGSIAEMLNRLHGMFGFALYDERNGRTIVARDHVGICPLYFGVAVTKNGTDAVWVSSEMKGLHNVCDRFQEVLPGQYWDSKEHTHPTFVPWYQPVWYDPTVIPYAPLNLSLIRDGLEAAVKRQLMTDVPMGVLLSGGLDSSLIAAIALKLMREEDPNAKLHSFVIGLVDSPDLKAARIVADALGTEHHEFHFTVQEGLFALSDVIESLETYDLTTIRAGTPMWLLARKIRSLGFKVVLSGGSFIQTNNS